MALVFEWLKTKLMQPSILFGCITKTKLMALVFDWLKTNLMKTNILFRFITKTKLMALVLDWLKTKETSPLSNKTKLM